MRKEELDIIFSDSEREVSELIKKEVTDEISNTYKNGKIKKKKNMILIFICLICFLFIAIMFGFNIYILNNMPKESQKADIAYSSTLLSNGLAIIGIAISVWAGLNIANAIERRELDDTNEKIKQVEEKIDIENETIKGVSKDVNNLIKDNENLINKSKELEPIISSLGDSTEKVSHTLGFMFENELIKTINDRATLFIYNKFSSLSLEQKYDFNKYYSELIIIEHLFKRIYDTHSSDQKKDIDLELLAENAISRIDSLLKDNFCDNAKPVYMYLKYRKAEFNYYLGYITADLQKYYDSFINAADLFLEVYEYFDVWLPKYENWGKAPEYLGKDKSKEISIYFANSIGDAYSRLILEKKIENNVIDKNGKLLQKNNMIEIGEKGVYYCSCAAKWSTPSGSSEVYYRNLGCAYERLERIEESFGKYYKQIIDNYSKAFTSIANYAQHSYRIQSVYHTLIQYLKKYLDYNLKVKEIFDDFENLIKPTTEYETLSNENAKYLKQLYNVTELAKRDNPRRILQHSVNGLTLSIIVFYKLKADKRIEEVCNLSIDNCIEAIKANISSLDIMGINDAYYKELLRRYNLINEHCKDSK